ncbi:MAG: hypothetical protein LC624_03765 [Halobacteriales archaeon]|nr:hypothetical protein [Halobacteriales archaeon]
MTARARSLLAALLLLPLAGCAGDVDASEFQFFAGQAGAYRHNLNASYTKHTLEPSGQMAADHTLDDPVHKLDVRVQAWRPADAWRPARGELVDGVRFLQDALRAAQGCRADNAACAAYRDADERSGSALANATRLAPEG